MRNRKGIALAAAGLLVFGLGAAPALAQEGHGQRGQEDRPAHRGTMHGKAAGHHAMGSMMMGGRHGGAMMAAMAFGPGPGMLLRQEDALELSDEQTSRLDSLRAAMRARVEEHRAGLEGVHGEMKELASSEEPSTDRYRELLERMADARVELAVEMARVHREAMAVLTEEQRARARYGMKLMHRMMRHHHGEAPCGETGHDAHGHGGGR